LPATPRGAVDEVNLEILAVVAELGEFQAVVDAYELCEELILAQPTS